jgi:preprotein translocase subunit SecF
MSRLMRAYRGENDVDFPTWGRRLLVVSFVLMAVSVVSLVVNGLSLSLEFEGGSTWAVPSKDFTESEARDVLGEFDAAEGAKLQEATTADGTRILRITSQVDDVNTGSEVADALAEAAGLEVGEVTVTTVGPSWGDDITRQAVQSLIWFTVLVAAYLAWRLEPKMALSAMLAIFHDVVITVGIYSLLGWEVTPATVIAFLTILGFSLYDTVVVFDRTKDGEHRYGRGGQYTYTTIMRRSLNQSLMRCVNTSITTLLPIFSMLLVGGYLLDQPLLIDFSRALIIGLMLGTYSSLFVASPIEVALKERERRWTEIRNRLVNKGMDVSDTRWHDRPTPVGAAAAGGGDAAGAARPGDAPPLSVNVGGHPPRPRKSRKR